MALLALVLAAAPVIDQAESISKGLEGAPIRYIAGFSLAVNLGLFAMLMRVQSLRVSELKEGAERAEKLGAIIEKHNQAMGVLDRLVAFVQGQLPRRKGGGGGGSAPPTLAVEPVTGVGGKP